MSALFSCLCRYRGRLATTVGGLPCQGWQSQSPHEHDYTLEEYDSSGLEGNGCRDPDGAEGRLWCYTTDPDTRWDYCEVDCAAEPASTTELSGCTTTTLQLAALKETPASADQDSRLLAQISIPAVPGPLLHRSILGGGGPC